MKKLSGRYLRVGGFASSGGKAAVFINERSECLHFFITARGRRIMETIMEMILSEGSAEFSRQGETYLIQQEHNKGCHYLSLWRTAPRAVCLSRVCFEVFDGVSEEIIEELCDQPLPDGRTVRELITGVNGDVSC